MFDFLSVIIFSAVGIATYYFVNRGKNQRIYELAAKLPGNDGYTFLQSILLMIRLSRKDYVSTIFNHINDEFPITKVWLFNKLLIVTKDADFIHKVFNLPQTYNKPDLFYKGFMTSKALVTLTKGEHKRHRKLLNKAFSSKMMKRLPDIFDEKSKKIIEIMSKMCDCGEFEAMDYIGAYSLEAFGKSNLNYEIEYYKSKIFDAYEHFSSVAVDFLPYSMVGITREMLALTKIGQRIKNVFQKFDDYFENVVKANRANKNMIESTAVDILLDPANGFSEDEIREEMIMMMHGAFETSTRTISTVLMMLGIHKDVQQKLSKEIEEVFSHEKDTEFNTDFLQKFSFLEMVIKETIRLFAVVPVVARETSKDVNINGYLIPKDTAILISINAMHRDEKYWGSDAHLFRPERFIDGPTNLNAFAPFTGGSRICLGNRYAMTSIKIFLINFLRVYNVNCYAKFEEIETEMTMTLNFINGYKISIYRK